jgi:phosphoribosylglycinamide formyltransferase 1
MLKMAFLASGTGTNLEALIRSTIDGELAGIASPGIVVCNVPGAPCIEKARRYGIETCTISHSSYSSREHHEKEIIERIRERGAELVVLAGYMRLLTPFFLKSLYRHQKGLPGVMNIHPALLPAFPGAHAYEDAYRYAVKVSGVTVHYVDEGIDTGPIILQESFPLHDDDTLESFKTRGLSVEHQLYAKAIALDASGKLRLEGRRVIIAP